MPHRLPHGDVPTHEEHAALEKRVEEISSEQARINARLDELSSAKAQNPTKNRKPKPADEAKGPLHPSKKKD